MHDLNDIHERFSGFRTIGVEKDVSLAPYTSYKIGGPARLLIAPKTETLIWDVYAYLSERGIRPFVLGHGSNVLVADEGWPGVTLYIGRQFAGWSWRGNRVHAHAGCLLLDVIRDAIARGFGGMELMAGIPGGVGGALRMNAGAFGQEIAGVVREVRGCRADGTPVTLNRGEIGFGYRSAPELDKIVITSAVFELEREEPDVLRKRMHDVLALRAEKQPLDHPSCGSVFKRPPGYYAGALIEEVGMKGYRHGNAQVSEKHAGFIVNLGGASAREVRELMEMVAGRVRDRFGVELEYEVKLVGFENATE